MGTKMNIAAEIRALLWPRRARRLDLSKHVRGENHWEPPRYRLRDERGLPLADLVNVRSVRVAEEIAEAVTHHRGAIEALLVARRRARNIKGAIETGQIEDKQVDVMAQDMFADLDAALRKINAVRIDAIISDLDQKEAAG